MHIINDILDLSKIEAGKMELEQIDFSLREVVEQVTQTLQHKAEEKGLALITDIDAHVHDVRMGDPTRLYQVLMNLTGNAIKYTEKGSVLIEIKKTPADQTLQFSIRDTGIGIPADKLKMVFENFAQAHTTDTRKFGGTGLGLSISKQLVELMGGTISIESEEGAGSVFSFILPLAPGSVERMKDQKAAEVMDGSMLDGLKILIVDDNEYNRIVVHDTLQLQAQVEIFQAVNGKEALALASRNDFDVILMDVQMPLLNGYDTTRYIRENFEAPKNQTPVIALTASVIRSDLDKCRAAGMNDYIPKPFKPAQLISAIAKATGREIRANEKVQPDKKERMVSPETVTNLSYLEKFCEGDTLQMQKYIALFTSSVPGLIASLSTALSNNEYEAIARQVHTHKAKWLMLGMHKSKDLAEIIERQCRDNIPGNALRQNVQTLIAQLNTAVIELT